MNAIKTTLLDGLRDELRIESIKTTEDHKYMNYHWKLSIAVLTESLQPLRVSRTKNSDLRKIKTSKLILILV